jgi:hypothetical protein
MIRAFRIYIRAIRLRYLQAHLARIPVTHVEWTPVFWEVKAAELRLWDAWDA